MSGEHSVEDMDGGCGAAERWGVGVVGFGMDADGVVVSEFDSDGIVEADDDVVVGGYEEDGVGRDPEDAALVVTLEEFGGAVEPGCEPLDGLGAEGVGSEDMVVWGVFRDGCVAECFGICFGDFFDVVLDPRLTCLGSKFYPLLEHGFLGVGGVGKNGLCGRFGG